MANETEERALQQSLVETLTGLTVHVHGAVGSFTEPLTAEGAQDVIDRLHARGFKISRGP
jgi:hypothetical protein